MILKAYQYFFYTLYRFYESSTYSRWWSEWKAYFSITALSVWFYAAIETCYHYFLDIPMESHSMINPMSILVFTVVSLINWYFFEYQNKWIAIVKECDQLSKKQKKIGTILVWLFILIVLIFYFFLSIPLLAKIKYR